MAVAKKTALYVLSAGLVLDRSVFATLDVEGMASNLEALRASPKAPLTVINNANTFFTRDNLLALIKAGDEDYKLITEQLKVIVTDADVDAIQRVERIVAAMKPPVPPYPFAPIPDGWTINKIAISTGTRPTVRRRNAIGNGIGYSITVSQLKRVWAVASKYWAKRSNVVHVHDIQAGGYYKTATAETSLVRVGCQTIERYELEQVAQYLGWDFPEPAAQ